MTPMPLDPRLRAMLERMVRPPQPPAASAASGVLFVLRLADRRGPAPTTALRALPPKGRQPVAAVPSYASNARGEMVVFWTDGAAAPPSSLRLELRLRSDGTWVRTAPIALPVARRRRVEIDRGLTLEIRPDADAGKRPASRRRRLALAVVGGADRLAGIGPRLRGRTCVRLKALFLTEGKIDPVPGVPIRDLKDLGGPALEGIDVLLDLCGTREVELLKRVRLSGRSGPLPLFVSGDSRVDLLKEIERAVE